MQTQAMKLIQTQVRELNLQRIDWQVYAAKVDSFHQIEPTEAEVWTYQFFENLASGLSSHQLSKSASLLMKLADQMPDVDAEVDSCYMIGAGLLNIIEELAGDSFTIEMEDAWVDYFCLLIDAVGGVGPADLRAPLSTQ